MVAHDRSNSMFTTKAYCESTVLLQLLVAHLDP